MQFSRTFSVLDVIKGNKFFEQDNWFDKLQAIQQILQPNQLKHNFYRDVLLKSIDSNQLMKILYIYQIPKIYKIKTTNKTLRNHMFFYTQMYNLCDDFFISQKMIDQIPQQ
jgi:hypothetical protein